MARDGMTRRSLLGVIAAGAATSACQGGDDADQSGDPGTRQRTPTPGDYGQAPTLAEQVDAGDLPPLDERLPTEPFVVQPGTLVGENFLTAQPGQYGGTLQLPQRDPTSDTHILLGNIEPLLWAPGGFDYDAGIEGNVVAGYEANDDDTAFTFHMREGLKWSDGEPVTIEDVRFAWEDVLNHDQITPVFPLYLRPGQRSDAPIVELEIIDDLTFSLTFAEPYGTFPAQVAIAQWRSYVDLIKPRHYLEQFHEKYADPAELAELLDAESIPEGDWVRLFNERQFGPDPAGNANAWMDISNSAFMGHPTLTAWTMTDTGTDVFTYSRNPYYFKIDSVGNQLPYMDGIRAQVVQDRETLTSRALFGEFDFLGAHGSLRQLPLIAEKADAGEVTMHVAANHRLPMSLALNLTYPDGEWREVVRDVRFRQALDLAINRDEIIDNLYLGEFASVPDETNTGVFDVDEANRLLDEIGMDERDGDGFRLGPSGERFTIPFEIAAQSEDHVPTTELIAEHWSDVGVHTTVRPIDGSLRGERSVANELLATDGWDHHPMWPSAGWTDYLPGSLWGPLWQEWHSTQGEIGEEPPDEVKELLEIHGRFLSARVGSDEFNAALEDILANHRENVWTFNPVEQHYYPTFWTSRIKNIGDGVKDDVFGVVLTISMEQWYIEE